MLKFSKLGFWYLSPTWIRSPIGTRITLRCDPGSPSLSRHHTLCRNINLSRNPSRSSSMSHSSTMSPTSTMSP